MPNEALTQFASQRYLNLESFKRDGTPVQTPVWFAEDDGTLYIYTLANAWNSMIKFFLLAFLVSLIFKVLHIREVIL